MKGVYIAHTHGYVKPGITGDLSSRMTGYSKGGEKPVIHFLAIADPGFDFHCINLENYIKAQLRPYFERHNYFDLTEYVDPKKHPTIDWKHIEKLTRTRIINAKQPIRVLKKEFLPLELDSAGLKTLFDSIKNFPEKYLEKIW